MQVGSDHMRVQWGVVEGGRKESGGGGGGGDDDGIVTSGKGNKAICTDILAC